MPMPALRLLTWHVHGSYLYYLSRALAGRVEFFLPVKPGRPDGYHGRAGSFPWGEHVHELAAEDVAGQQFDAVLFQSRANYLEDQQQLLAPWQRTLPRLYLEHDPPRESPTETRHVVDDPNVLLIHVTHFNALMWNNNRTPVRVIDHGVCVPEGARYSGDLARGLVVVNNLRRRGRRLGADLYDVARTRVPLDIAGMATADEEHGLGDLPLERLHALAGRYRFFFHPIRYTSLGLAVLEAMAIGLPIVGLATTELVTVIENGVNGYLDTSLERLIARMNDLLNDPAEAQRLGANARRSAEERFNLTRFGDDWLEALSLVSGRAAGVAAGG
jgi:glycosyltransferase involved in cell wall biosynthesis